MLWLKRAVRKTLRHFGLDVVAFHHAKFGVDPYVDMQRFLHGQPDLMLLDIGANVGQSTCRFKEFFPTAEVHAFEPSPTTFQQLQTQCAGQKDVHLWNNGVGSVDSSLTFQENEHSDMSSFLAPSQAAWGKVTKSTTVPVITLDKFAKEHGVEFVHVLKSDTQGYDWEVFKGARGLMAENRIALIYFEFIFSDMYTGLPRFDEVYRYLTDNNFLLVTFYQAHYQQNRIGWTDFLFVNRAYYDKFNGTAIPSPSSPQP